MTKQEDDNAWNSVHITYSSIKKRKRHYSM